MNNSFFIVGVGRSGTSLLQSILSSHSKIRMPPETGFLRNAFFSFTKHEDFTFERFIGLYPRLERFSETVFGNLSRPFSDELSFYCTILNASNEQIIGDKDPRLIEYIGGTSKMFPEAKFIHLIRDPRDVLLSKKKAQWSKGRPSWYHIFANYVQLKLGEWQGRQLPADKYLIITYEDLLNAPEDTVAEICGFLNVNFEQQMLSFQEKAKELVSEEETQWKKETMGPLLKNNTGKWKGKLAYWEVALTEKLCKQAFKIGNYKSSGSYRNLSFVQKMNVSLLSLLLRGFGSIYIPYRLWSQKILVAWKY
jgi:hypothetical protein